MEKHLDQLMSADDSHHRTSQSLSHAHSNEGGGNVNANGNGNGNGLTGNVNGNGNGLNVNGNGNGVNGSGNGSGNGNGTQYGIQYQNRDGDESVIWGAGGRGHLPGTPRSSAFIGNAQSAGTATPIGAFIFPFPPFPLSLQSLFNPAKEWCTDAKAKKVTTPPG